MTTFATKTFGVNTQTMWYETNNKVAFEDPPTHCAFISASAGSSSH